jgi:hypothetical protein
LNTRRHARCGHASFHFIHQRGTDEKDVPGQLGVELEVHNAAELLNDPLIFVRALPG